jgi:hypothetical protein
VSAAYHLINIHSFLYDHTIRLIHSTDINPLMEEVTRRPTGFTGMLLIPRDLPNAEDLVRRISGLRSDSLEPIC